MRILITNDDGYDSKGLLTLVEIMRPLGEITVISPKKHQSGMSMAVNLGRSPVSVKKIKEEPGVSWWYLDGTPSSCVKFGIDNIFPPDSPDLVLSGINHGGNFGTAYCYSGTIGAASEGALAGIPSVAVSLDAFGSDLDFSAVKTLFPNILGNILAAGQIPYGTIFNVNFPNIPIQGIKGVRLAKQSILRWVNEFIPYDRNLFRRLASENFGILAPELPEAEEGEEQFMMAGDIVNDSAADPLADINLLKRGYITITCHQLLSYDPVETKRLKDFGVETDY